MGGIFFAAHRGKIEANSTLIDTLERGIKKGGCFVEQSPFWGCFYEAKTRKIIACEVRKPLILLHFSKNPISPLAPYRVFITDLSYGHSIFSAILLAEMEFVCTNSLLVTVSDSNTPCTLSTINLRLSEKLLFGCVIATSINL